LEEIKFNDGVFNKFTKIIGIGSGIFGACISCLALIDNKYGSPFLGVLFISVASYLYYYSVKNTFTLGLRKNDLFFLRGKGRTIEIKFENIDRMLEFALGGLEIQAKGGESIKIPKDVQMETQINDYKRDVISADYILLKKIFERSGKKIE